MKMKEIIEKVSELYREERGKEYDLQQELNDVSTELAEADHERGENITLARYQYLRARKMALRNEIDLLRSYYNGMSAVRELLMDLGFDTEVK